MLNGLRTNCYKVTMLFQRQGDKKSVWICPAHPHTTYAFITKELRLDSLLVKFQNNFFRHFTRIARRTHIASCWSGANLQLVPIVVIKDVAARAATKYNIFFIVMAAIYILSKTW